MRVAALPHASSAYPGSLRRRSAEEEDVRNSSPRRSTLLLAFPFAHAVKRSHFITGVEINGLLQCAKALLKGERSSAHILWLSSNPLQNQSRCLPNKPARTSPFMNSRLPPTAIGVGGSGSPSHFAHSLDFVGEQRWRRGPKGLSFLFFRHRPRFRCYRGSNNRTLPAKVSVAPLPRGRGARRADHQPVSDCRL